MSSNKYRDSHCEGYLKIVSSPDSDFPCSEEIYFIIRQFEKKKLIVAVMSRNQVYVVYPPIYTLCHSMTNM